MDRRRSGRSRPSAGSCARSATSCSTSACSACWSAFAAGKIFGYEGQVIVLSGGGQFCNTGILGYDSFRAGLRVDGTDLQPFCVRVDDFTATYEHSGQPASYTATVGYQTAADLAAGTDSWRSATIAVNHPLRTDGSRVYLLGHGYAPRFTVTYPDGQQRTGEVQWRPVDQTTLLSEGATKFARPGVTDEEQRRTSQLAVTGLLAPTSSGGQVVTSVFPALRRSRGGRRRAARRPRAGRRARAVDLHGRPEQARLRRADAGGAGEHAAGRRDHAGRRHPRPLRRRARLGVAAGQPRSRAGVGAGVGGLRAGRA